MHMKTIVVPFDFSPDARVALSAALQLAKSTASGIIVVHILHESPFKLAAASGETEMDELIRKDELEKSIALQQETEEMLHSLHMEFPPGQIRIKALYSPLIVEKIIELANGEDAGLIIMGTHGATGLQKVLFGSNTSHMIARSALPVLAIPGNYSYKPAAKFLYASDFENLEAELRQIIPFAIAMNTVIDVLHLDYGPNDKKISTEKARTVILQSPYQYIHLVTREASNIKPLLRQIKQYAEETKPDWLLMFTKEKNNLDKLFMGSHTEDMSQSLPIPLLSFKKQN